MDSGTHTERRCGTITNPGHHYPLPCVKPEGHSGPCDPVPQRDPYEPVRDANGHLYIDFLAIARAE